MRPGRPTGTSGAPRHFVFWREPALRAVLDAAGWEVDEVHHTTSTRTGEPWLDVRARRR